MYCEICGKPPAPYPNWVLARGHAYHLGCLSRDYQRLMRLVLRLYDIGMVSGQFGPWSSVWTAEDQTMWERLDDLQHLYEIPKELT